MTAIKLENISYKYPKATKEALSLVNLEIPEGSFFALLGPNGAGKTTMLRLLCGRFGAFSGELKIDEKLRGPNGFLDPKSYGILLENPGTYPKLSIEEYVNYFAGFYGVSTSRERMSALSQKLELPDLSTRLSALSLGNRQKVQILRAMIHNPKLLILDEPVANLDPVSRETVWNLISDWRKQEGGTAIVCSHILAEMESEATDFAIINRGAVLKQGRVSELACDKKSFQLELPQNMTEEQIRTALEKAGLSGIQIKQSKTSLSDLYRNTVQ
ncbi:ABC transporter ATP-binding protein [Fibrobacter sp. UWEL]|uniref:ABC transporter ATP-binding protein n=1 Tax=Fibrobacter sp. UWEL TaxID=1896209 RepID=UPI000918B339|nr:ABC transporter ATP-binding protein [Fibrobacter sp. UWEL]SHK35534.1 ABC-2 type transport system ATP-binding protein [Fibrobacter sp. UWEL]